MCNGRNAVKLSEIISYIETLAPRALQESYDNSGLILGDTDACISKALVCLDADQNALDLAVKQDCQLVLSHHPAIFKSMKTFTEDSSDGKLLVKAIKNDVALYSAHTNFDSASGGLTDLLCDRLGLHNNRIIIENSESTEGGFGRCGTIDAVSGEDFIKLIKTKLSLPVIRFIGSIPENISNVAVYNGSYDAEILKDLLLTDADVLITGDIKYHDAQELIANSMFTIDAGHYGTEKIFVEEVAVILENKFSGLTVLRYEGADVFDFA